MYCHRCNKPALSYLHGLHTAPCAHATVARGCRLLARRCGVRSAAPPGRIADWYHLYVPSCSECDGMMRRWIRRLRWGGGERGLAAMEHQYLYDIRWH
eukprot:1194696-Prorocentrum_minimum.AAC.8